MKTTTKITLCVWAFLMFVAVDPARAFYDPGTQRWLNRDPINERGFELLNHPYYARKSHFDQDYTFLRNSPLTLIDPLGLLVWGRSCKRADIDEMKKALDERCRKARKGKCFDCLGEEGKQQMREACASRDGQGPTVECEDGTQNRCQTTPQGHGCGWTDSGGNRTVHICLNQAKSECGDHGCTLLHEISHSVGGVGADTGALKPDNRGYTIERCAGCYD